jgi:hypothetical protein
MYLSGKNLLTLNAFSFASKMDSSIGESDLFLSLSSSSSISGLQVSNLKPASERIFFLSLTLRKEQNQLSKFIDYFLNELRT